MWLTQMALFNSSHIFVCYIFSTEMKGWKEMNENSRNPFQHAIPSSCLKEVKRRREDWIEKFFQAAIKYLVEKEME